MKVEMWSGSFQRFAPRSLRQPVVFGSFPPKLQLAVKVAPLIAPSTPLINHAVDSIAMAEETPLSLISPSRPRSKASHGSTAGIRPGRRSRTRASTRSPA